jgi:hypothetical protein
MQTWHDDWRYGYACFYWFPTASWHHAGTTAAHAKTISTSRSRDGIMLLIFKARLPRRFRFVLAVTILQQVVASLGGGAWQERSHRPVL